ncbi:chondroitin sulfate proteoglycan 4-like [Rhineura floridana]|uniref:chondroitin sulfate proteoglycan 4-like n=1 Tax=Rhineura floridana TaxID=261503 RepID=UPI002AC854B8|nr:chondroitin sulfate proteoglycan 4-like [Rhineura floridana]
MAQGWGSGSALLLLLLAISREALAVSFYGKSYVHLNFAESSTTTFLKLRFQTSRPDGLLFLAEGKDVYFLVELHSGNVQVRINLGVGEQILHSQGSPQLNDLMWHLIEVHRERDSVTLIIDKSYQATTKVPGVLFELNFQHGLYVGGSGGLDVPYLDGTQTNFRGCIDDVIFNKHDILTSLRPSPRFKNVHEVSLSCSDEFFAGEEEPISFFSSKSYVSFPLWNIESEGVLEYKMQTTAQKGLLQYSSGPTGDFVAMEIENGLIKAYIGKGKNRFQLSSLSTVSDNQWHSVKLKISAEHIELMLGKETVKKQLPSHTKLPILKGAFYVGGVNDATRAEVVKLGLTSISGRYAQGGSFRGCLRDLKINLERKSLKDVLVTKDISAGCKTESAFSTNPLGAPGKQPVGTAAAGTVASKLPGKESQDHFLVLNNLIVPEGGQAALESKHIKVNVEFKKLGIRQSQIVFKIKDQPSHGRLRLDVEPEHEESTFTMLDLWQGRVLYVHDGSEESYDYFTFSVSTSSKKEMPLYLQGSKKYMFTITVRPINDAPELTLPNGNLFLLLEHSKKCLSIDSVNVSDSDTSAGDLSITVLGNLNADAGFLENSKIPGKAITVFSYKDLQNGNVFFVHTGVKNSRIVLRASDSEKVSNTVVLRVVAVPLEYKLVNNTGADMLQGSAALIRLSNLAVETNAFQQELEIRYDITEPPLYGEIQRWQAGREWKETNTFSQRSIERGRVRYASTFKEIQQDNALEYFKFKVSISSKRSEEFLFSIMVKWLRYNLLRHVPLVIDISKKVYLSSDHLLAVIAQVEVPANEFYYQLLSLPEKGNILLNNIPLQINSTFSQQDISDYKVEYQLIKRSHEETQDSFQFLISTKYVVSNIYDFKISIKTDPQSILLTNNGLTVTEGEGKLITKLELFAQTVDNKTFQYKVTKSPRHGKLMLINFSDSQESNNNLSSFTNQDIIGKRLMYVHDDSETQYDEIHITTTATESGEWMSRDTEMEPALSAEIKFNISVQLKNDEKPRRVVDEVFHVVKSGRKLLTLADLCYHDPDTDFDDKQLLYTRRGIPNGDLVLVNETSHRLYQFKQEDLAQKQVLFMHHGAAYGRFVLFVTDGKHYTSSLLEVSASDPYVRLANNTGLLIQKGREGTITTANLSATTNQDIRSDHEITFEISLSPKYGQVLVNNLVAGTFTQHDLNTGHVTYRHDDSNNLVDTFDFTVYAKAIQLDAEVNVRIFLESHQRPPAIVQNSNLLVEEGKPVKITTRNLLVVHENSLPSEIEFKVRLPPVYGYLRKFTSEESYLGVEENPVLTFTQQDINDGNIQYVQTFSNQLQDQFSLDVTNGIWAVSGIEIAVDIIPKAIPLEVHNFTVIEGGSKTLDEDFLTIPNSHFAGLKCEFSLIEPPKHGCIANANFPGMPVMKFTKKQLEQGFIFYIHDDSEELLDNFTIIANSTELWKQSLPQMIFVTVTPINDEAPVVRRNKIFRVWVGSVTEITVNDLCAEDKDSSPAELWYSISHPNNGHLALKSSPNKSILNFTQAHIEEGQLVFVHSGAMSGGFNFQVTDGLNFAPRQIFSITARTLVIHLENNNGLTLFPGSRKPITSHNLKAVTNDVGESENRTILFTVANPPKLGRLISAHSDNSTQDITSFTQSMVDDGIIIYEHAKKEALDWNTQDSFMFTVSSPPAVLGPQVFHINISYEIKRHDQSSQLLANTGAVVQEGGKVLIDKTNLDSSNLLSKLPKAQRSTYEVWYQVTSLPKHGTIVVGERNITREKPNFSQYIVNKFGITYIHDDSESFTDQFMFAVWLNQKSKSATKPHSGVLEETFNITVVPVNDHAPGLKTKVLHLNVLQGDTAVLGPKNLKVEDLDNVPEEIKYTIISNPQNGYLALWTCLSEPIKDFTQADVDNGRVWFVQDGTSSSGVFYFSVTDGKHRPLYKLFNIEVTPTSVTLVNLTEVVLPQGQNSVAITNIHLSATTNGRNTEIVFEVTEPLSYGHLLIGNEQVTMFRQADLYAGRLMYCMTDITAFRDMLEFTVFTLDSNLTGQVMNITVQPLVQMALDLSIPNRVAYKLKASDLDASELANLTISNPRFEVTVPPAYGRVLRRSLSNAKSEILSVFTQSDIDSGAIFLEADVNMTGVNELNDSFTFILRADNVQPAMGQFHYAIVPHDPSLIQTFTPEVALLTSATILNSYTVTKNEPLFFPKGNMHTEAPREAQWHRQNHQKHQNDKDTRFNEEVARGRSVWDETTIKTSFRSTWVQPPHSSNWLFVIIPLASVAVLFTVSAVAVCVFLMCHKPRKAKPLIAEQPPDVLSSPSFSPERSLTVPAVTVTPLLKGAGKTTAFPFMSLRQEQVHPVPVAPAPAAESLLQSNWTTLDPEMIQHCRKTNPTLNRNQYWV